MTPPEKWFSLAEASRVTGKSVSTIRRNKQRLVSYGAKADPTGWSIPATALAACGWLSEIKGVNDTPVTPPSLNDQLEAAQLELTVTKQALAVAEAIAAERLDALQVERERVGELQRAITAGTSPTPEPAAPATAEPSAPPAPGPSPLTRSGPPQAAKGIRQRMAAFVRRFGG